jgi:putative nucleotidyltransferase with HDIG domain
MVEGAPKVLVVDDDAAFGSMVAETLRERGFDAACVSDPNEALLRAGAGDVAVAIVDLVMPGMSGLDLVERLREASPGTQFVILTGHGDIQSAVAGIRHGIFDYLHKAEVKAERLWHVIDGAVERSRLLRRNLELVDALADSNRLLTSLHAHSAGLAAEQHLDRLQARIVAAARDLCGAGAARVLLMDRSHTDELLIARAAGDGVENLAGVRLRPGQGVAPLALVRDAAVAVADSRAHARFDARCDALPTPLPGYLSVPLRHGDVVGVLIVAGSRGPCFSAAEQEALATLARQAAVALDNSMQRERAANFFTHACDLLVELLEAVDVNLPGHSRGVAALSDMLTRRMGLSDAERRGIHFGALLHDVGKFRVDRRVLTSGAAPTAEEWAELRAHPILGLEILQPITAWEDILAIVHAHHERWDGKGYPRRLAGEEIPLGARVVAVADAYDAIARPDSAKRSRQGDDAVAELEAGAGTQFDPRLVRLFVAEIRANGDPRFSG